MKDKDNIPQEVIDYCIDNRVSVEEGMTAVIDMRLEAVEKNFASLKGEVKQTINEIETKVTAQEIEDVESFLNSLDQQIQD
jgi:phage-related minor tail protein